MSTTLSIKGQFTIPKQIRDALGLKPGMPVDFAVNQDGEMVIHKADVSFKRKSDQFEAVRGRSDGKQRILDIQPTKLHQRVAVFLGSRNEVERVTRYHAE